VRENKKSKTSDFLYLVLQCVAKNIEGWLKIWTSYLVYSNISKLFLGMIATFSTRSYGWLPLFGLATNKKFLKTRPLLRYIAICKRRWTWLPIRVEPTCWKKNSHTVLIRFSWLYARGQVFAYADFHDHQTSALSLSLLRHSGCSFTKFLPREKECEFWICFLMDCFARVLHCLPYNFPSSISSVWSSQLLTRKARPQWTSSTHQCSMKDEWSVVRKQFSVGFQFRR
jgi:hypothetical protein